MARLSSQGNPYVAVLPHPHQKVCPSSATQTLVASVAHNLRAAGHVMSRNLVHRLLQALKVKDDAPCQGGSRDRAQVCIGSSDFKRWDDSKQKGPHFIVLALFTCSPVCSWQNAY